MIVSAAVEADFLEKRELSLPRSHETFDDPRSFCRSHADRLRYDTTKFRHDRRGFSGSFSQPLTGGTEGDGKSKQIFFFTDRRFILKSFPALKSPNFARSC